MDEQSAVLSSIKEFCLAQKSGDPYEILHALMKKSFVPIHGPVHHFRVGASLLTAFANAGGKIDLAKDLDELFARASYVPGAACGYWGVCGAAISSSMAISIIAGTGPLSEGDRWTVPMKNTIAILQSMDRVGGPRCCKRDSFLSIINATQYMNKTFGSHMKMSIITCDFSPLNHECIKTRCPFHPIGLNS